MTRRRHYHVIVKPSCACNINCEYCYDYKNRLKYKNTLMDYSTFEHIIKLLNDYTQELDLLWHGGEPTVVPIDWYKGAQEVIHKYYTLNVIQNLQSNGLRFIQEPSLLDEFHALNIRTGISFDIYTQATRLGKNSEKIMDDYCDLLFRNHNYGTTGIISALTVITSKNITKLIDMYDYMKKKFAGYEFKLSFLFVSQHQEEVKTLEVPTELLIPELKKFYNYMIFDTSSDAYMENDMLNILDALMYKGTNCQCHLVDCRRTRLGFQPDGEVMFCDTQFERFPIGNVKQFNSIEEIFESPMYLKICDQIEKRYQKYCYNCAYFSLCKGDCNHAHMTPDGYLDECNPHICYEIKTRLALIYNILQSINKNTKINVRFKAMLESKKSLLPLEIEEFLKEKGIYISMYIPNAEDIKTKFVEKPQFKLFQIFTSKYNDRPHALFSKHRYELFEIVYNEHKTEIDKLIKECRR